MQTNLFQRIKWRKPGTVIVKIKEDKLLYSGTLYTRQQVTLSDGPVQSIYLFLPPWGLNKTCTLKTAKKHSAHALLQWCYSHFIYLRQFSFRKNVFRGDGWGKWIIKLVCCPQNSSSQGKNACFTMGFMAMSVQQIGVVQRPHHHKRTFIIAFYDYSFGLFGLYYY